MWLPAKFPSARAPYASFRLKPEATTLDSVTVPGEVPPPVTLVGFIVTACNVAAGGGVVGARCGRTTLAITAALGASA